MGWSSCPTSPSAKTSHPDEREDGQHDDDHDENEESTMADPMGLPEEIDLEEVDPRVVLVHLHVVIVRPRF